MIYNILVKSLLRNLTFFILSLIFFSCTVKGCITLKVEKKNREEKELYNDGSVKIIKTFANNKLVNVKRFYTNGQIESEIGFDGDELDGMALVFRQDGSKLAEGYHTDNQRSGYWKYYDYEGKLIRTKNYGTNKIDWQDETNEYEQYKTIYKNIVNVPKQWELDTSTDDKAIQYTFLSTDTDSNYSPFISIQYSDKPTNAKDELIEGFINLLTEEFSNIRFTEIHRDTIINGNNILGYMVGETIENRKVYTLHASLTIQKNKLMIMYAVATVAAGQDERYETLFRYVLTTVRL